jgi:hypothetical protein
MANATRKLDTLRRKLDEARQAEREVTATPGLLRDEVDRLGQEYVDNHDTPLDGGPPASGAARKAWDAWHGAKVRLDGPWPQRLQKARAETQRREAELGRFVVDHLGELVGEIEPTPRRRHATSTTPSTNCSGRSTAGMRSRVGSPR